MNNRLPNKPNLPVKDPKVMAHLMGLGLDCTDGHKRITQAEKFSVLGGSDQTHDKMTETLCKTFEDLPKKGKVWKKLQGRISDLIKKNSSNLKTLHSNMTEQPEPQDHPSSFKAWCT